MVQEQESDVTEEAGAAHQLHELAGVLRRADPVDPERVEPETGRSALRGNTRPTFRAVAPFCSSFARNRHFVTPNYEPRRDLLGPDGAAGLPLAPDRLGIHQEKHQRRAQRRDLKTAERRWSAASV